MNDCQSRKLDLSIKMLMFRKSGSLVKLWLREGVPKVLCAARSCVPVGSKDLPLFHLVMVLDLISFLR